MEVSIYLGVRVRSEIRGDLFPISDCHTFRRRTVTIWHPQALFAMLHQTASSARTQTEPPGRFDENIWVDLDYSIRQYLINILTWYTDSNKVCNLSEL